MQNLSSRFDSKEKNSASTPLTWRSILDCQSCLLAWKGESFSGTRKRRIGIAGLVRREEGDGSQCGSGFYVHLFESKAARFPPRCSATEEISPDGARKSRWEGDGEEIKRKLRRHAASPPLSLLFLRRSQQVLLISDE